MLQEIIINIAALIVTLGILITIHEYGHFWVARRCGVKVERFSIGFGKPLLRWNGRDGTEYIIAVLPLGGYVKMLGQDDTDVVGEIPQEKQHMAFNYKPLWQRAAIVSAGPIANFLLAILVYWLIFMAGVEGVAPVVSDVEQNSLAYNAGLRAGDEILAVDGVETLTWQTVTMQLLDRLGESGTLQLRVKLANSTSSTARGKDIIIALDRWQLGSTEPMPLKSLGITPYRLDIPALIGEIIPGGRAEEAGLEVNDVIIRVNGKSLAGWFSWVEIVRSNAEKDLNIVVERGILNKNLVIRPAAKQLMESKVKSKVKSEVKSEVKRGAEAQWAGYIGAGVQVPDPIPSLPESMRREQHYNFISAWQPAINETWNKSVFILKSIKKMVSGLISVKNLSGPITIAKVAGETASYSLQVYLGFLAVLSISLGVLNLLPIPVLDGGHLLYYFIEFVIRRPVPEKMQMLGLQLGVLIISSIMIMALYNDVTRLF